MFTIKKIEKKNQRVVSNEEEKMFKGRKKEKKKFVYESLKVQKKEI